MKKISPLFFALLPLLAFAELQSDDLNKDDAKNRKIVVFKAGTSDDSKKSAVENAGGKFGKHLGSINGVAAHFPNEESAKNAAGNANVLRVDEDIVVEATVVKDSFEEAGNSKGQGNKPGGTTPPPPPPPQETPWGISKVQAPAAWSVNQGAGVNVCVIDTGIDLDHPDLQANIKGSVNTISPTKSADDDNGHGTHVAGTIAAVNNTIGVIGVAPQANLLAVKVLSRSGSGWLSDIIEGLQWCAANGGKVANLSLGSSSDSQSFHDAVTAAVNAGVTVVAAAGNSGPCTNCVGYPARYEEAIAVSASDSNDLFASFSSQGPEVDLIAPGKSVKSSYKGGGYATLSGTSMATPHVSGAAALKLAQDGTLTPAQVRDALRANTDNIGLSADQQGAGRLNAAKLVGAVTP